jgi:hypothetical protein
MAQECPTFSTDESAFIAIKIIGSERRMNRINPYLGIGQTIWPPVIIFGPALRRSSDIKLIIGKKGDLNKHSHCCEDMLHHGGGQCVQADFQRVAMFNFQSRPISFLHFLPLKSPSSPQWTRNAGAIVLNTLHLGDPNAKVRLFYSPLSFRNSADDVPLNVLPLYHR